MEYINKSLANKAHKLLKNFLDRCLSYNPYPSDLYEALRDDLEQDTILNPQQERTYRLLLKWILEESRLLNDGLGDGEGYCCYCMRRICYKDTHSTLEHVIPKSIDQGDIYNKYYEISSNLEKDQHVMVPKRIFEDRHRSIAPPCPHNVAYENLIASCDGSLPKGSHSHRCCNGPRSDHFIPPLMFIRTINNEIKYKKNGIVVWQDNLEVDKRERYKVITEILKLNDEVLMSIRLIWNHLNENGLDCNLKDAQRLKVIDTLRYNYSHISDVLQNFLQDSYWNLLDEYRYFSQKNRFTP